MTLRLVGTRNIFFCSQILWVRIETGYDGIRSIWGLSWEELESCGQHSEAFHPRPVCGGERWRLGTARTGRLNVVSVGGLGFLTAWRPQGAQGTQRKLKRCL